MTSHDFAHPPPHRTATCRAPTRPSGPSRLLVFLPALLSIGLFQGGATITDIPKAPGLDFLQVPRVRALGLTTLIRRLEQAAKGISALPKSVNVRLKQLRIAEASLSAALAERGAEGSNVNVESPARIEADTNMDNSVRILSSCLLGWRLLPGEKGVKAGEAFTSFFGDGNLTFLLQDFDDEWADINTRLKRIDADGSADKLIEIGGKDVLDHVRAMHKEYGRVLGITAGTEKAAKVSVADPLAVAQDSVRRYMAAVIAFGADSDIDPSVIPVAEALLEPIESLRAKLSQKSSGRSADEDPATPADDATPADGTKKDPKPQGPTD